MHVPISKLQLSLALLIWLMALWCNGVQVQDVPLPCRTNTLNGFLGNIVSPVDFPRQIIANEIAKVTITAL